MRCITLLNPYSFYYIYKTEEGKKYINSVVNTIIGNNYTYKLLPFLNENINNVRSYVILESKENIVFIDFNFKQNDKLLKTDYALLEYLRYTNNKKVILLIINDFKGSKHEINDIHDIYINSFENKNIKYLYSKNYIKRLILNSKITKILNNMNEEEYKIYLHENELKEKI